MSSGKLARRAHLGLDLALPAKGVGLEVMDLPEGSPLAGQAAVGERLVAIDGFATDDLDGVRDVVRGLRVGKRCLLEFQGNASTRRVDYEVPSLPIETVDGSCVELGEVLIPASASSAAYRLRSVWTFPRDPDGSKSEGSASAKSHPLVWLLPGATWLSDEHVQEPWHPTLKLVRALARLGFATLRVDRAGVGDSEGPLCTETDLEAELGWWRAAHSAIAGEPRIDDARVFLFGRSLGGVMAQLIGAEIQPRGVALWGTTSLRWHDSMRDNARRIAKLRGLREPGLSEYLAQRDVLAEAIYVGGEIPDEVRTRLPELSTTALAAFQGTFAHGRSVRFFQQLQARDIGAACRAIHAPVLVMRGELDWISGVKDAESVVAAARQPTYLHFEGVDHLMHHRDDVAEAFTYVYGGEFDPSGAEAIARFFAACESTE